MRKRGKEEKGGLGRVGEGERVPKCIFKFSLE